MESSGGSLMKGYYNKKHILYVDNWYTSPDLFQFSKSIPKGKVQSASTENLLAIKWHDKKFFHMLSSVPKPHGHRKNCARKSLKWYKKLFFHLTDLSLYNAFVLFQVVTENKPSFSEFRLAVVTQLLDKYPVPVKKHGMRRSSTSAKR
nr:unnamed protein product [Callosobruchus analis]